MADGREVLVFHIVAHAVDGRLLFRSWPEGLEVWRAVLGVVPHPDALCVMPDHLHLLCPMDVRARVGRALGGLARRRNAREGRQGPLVRRLPDAAFVPPGKLLRVRKYIHMNPCRAGLVRDPLAWPLSTHRDALGLTWPRVGPARRDRFHQYVSSDASTAVAGTLLPGGVLAASEAHEVLAAVSCVLRAPTQRLGRNAVARSLVWHACCELRPTSKRALADELSVAERTLRRLVPVEGAALARVRRVVCDPRFEGLHDGSLLHQTRWAYYRRIA